MLDKLFSFIENSPSCFHAVAQCAARLEEAGYVELKEKEAWEIVPGGKYYAVRNGSTIAAVRLPEGAVRGFHIAASHSDSPTFKVKERPEIKSEEKYVKLNTEKYGGMILSTWLDRPLSVAGRVVVKEDGKFVSRLVNVDKDLLVIPNVAIHMCRDMNKGVEYNAQTDMLPLFGGPESAGAFEKEVAQAAGVKPEDILGSDLYLYVREKGRRFGAAGEYICSPKLDDLECAFGTMEGLLTSEPSGEFASVCVVFDNEEVGSGTKQGAASTFLEDVLVRVSEGLGKTPSQFRQMLAESFVVSADNAHAVHPNHPEKADPTNKPFLNEGIVIKYHGSQHYTTDAVSGAVIADLCREAGAPFQTFANRSDSAGGSTLGNISTAHISVDTADIGLPQLAMHSACETAGAKDIQYLVDMMRVFYSR